MARELWAKIDVGLRHHPKLIGRPDADFRLWVGLILHAKEHCADFVVRDLSPSDMRGAFGIKAPTRIVVAGLAYFLRKGMLVETPDGGLLIRDMEERQGRYDQDEQRTKWRDIKRRQRDKSSVSTVDNGGRFPSVLPLEEEEEEDQKKEPKIIAPSSEKPTTAPTPFVSFVRAEWRDLKNPAAFEKRVRKAFPGIDPLIEAQKARGWELADPQHLKVKHGRFLWNWMTTADERMRKGDVRGPPRNGATQLHVDNDALNAEPPGRKFL